MNKIQINKILALFVVLAMFSSLPYAVMGRSGDDSGSSDDNGGDMGSSDDSSSDDNSVGDRRRGADKPEDNGINGIGDRRRGADKPKDNGNDGFPDLRGDGTLEDNGINGIGDRRRGADKPEDNGINGIGDRRRGADKPEDNVEIRGIANMNTLISQNKAIDLAKGAVSGNIDRVEQEIENDRIVWKVRVNTNDGIRADVRVDANTGAILRTRVRGEDFDIRQRNDVKVKILNKDTKIDENDAADIAERLTPGKVNRIEQEMEDNGRLVWKVRLNTDDHKRADIRVDAETGVILRTDVQEDNSGRGILSLPGRFLSALMSLFGLQ